MCPKRAPSTGVPLHLGFLLLVSAASRALAAASTSPLVEAEALQLLQTFAEQSSVEAALRSEGLSSHADVPASDKEAVEPRDRLLLFYAVGSRPDVIENVVKNIDHARAFEAGGRAEATFPLKIDVYLAHYDYNRTGWQKATGDWYAKNVEYSAELKGIKFTLAKDLLLPKHKTNYRSKFWRNGDDFLTPENLEDIADSVTVHETKMSGFQNVEKQANDDAARNMAAEKRAQFPAVDINSYEFIWFLDEDGDFTAIDVRNMVTDARLSGASIAAPAVLFPGEDGDPRVERNQIKRELRRLWFNNSGSIDDIKGLTAAEKEEALKDAQKAQSSRSIWRWLQEMKRLAMKNAVAERAAKAAEFQEPYIATNRQRHGEAGGAYEVGGISSTLGCGRLDLLCALQAPASTCDYRYTNFVEVSFPLLKPQAFTKVLGDCPICLAHRASVWGLDRLWCHMAADSYWGAQRSCAILDRHSLIHENLRTLPKHHGDSRQVADYFNQVTQQEAKERAGQFWVQEVRTLSCSKSGEDHKR